MKKAPTILTLRALSDKRVSPGEVNRSAKGPLSTAIPKGKNETGSPPRQPVKR